MSQRRIQADGQTKVLILEDDATIANILGRMLKALTYQSTWVETGEAAIASCQEAKAKESFYDVALLDLTIAGGLGGREALKEMLRIDPELKAIACSGYSDDDLNRELISEGFTAILPKPFKSQDLARVLKSILD